MTHSEVKRGRRAVAKPILAAVVAVIVVFAAVAVYIVSSGSAAPNASACGASAPSGVTPVDVSIYKGAYNSDNPPGYTPDTITVVIGVNNTVVWTNNDSIHHTVTTTSAPSGGLFNSGNMNAGATCSHTFNVAGSYQYDCVYHPWMTGTVVVKAS